MKRNYKAYLLITVIMMLTTVLVACGNSSSSEEPPVKDPVSEEDSVIKDNTDEPKEKEEENQGQIGEDEELKTESTRTVGQILTSLEHSENLDKKHINNGLKCETCHESIPSEDETPAIPKPETCFSCHGNDYGELPKAYSDYWGAEEIHKKVEIHIGELYCIDCHNVHQETELYCSTCH